MSSSIKYYFCLEIFISPLLIMLAEQKNELP
jgi:hypothetical protein